MAKETTKKTTKTAKATSSAKATKKTTKVSAAAKASKASKTAKVEKPAAIKQVETVEAVTPITPAAPVKLDAKAANKAKATKQFAGPSSKLKKWNYWLAGLYALQAIAIVVLGNKTAVPITIQYPASDTLASEAVGHQVVGGAFRQLFNVELGWMVAAFLIVFATVRYMAARKTRVQDQPGSDRAISTLRWMGFGLGGGLIVVTIGLLSGFNSIGTLLLLWTAVIAGATLAFVTEVLIDRNKGMWTRLVRLLGNMSVVAVVLPWVVFGLALGAAALWAGNLPTYMYSVYGCVALLFLGTILATYFYFARQGRWADPLYAERSYMLLEVLTASFLAWQIFAGVLHA
jgi:hypothetical protein